MSAEHFVFGPFVLDARRSTLTLDGEAVPVGHRALAVLNRLLSANGQVVTKAELMDFAWPGVIVEESNLSVQIAALRKVLSVAVNGHAWIATVARVGYRFAGPVLTCDTGARLPATGEAPRSAGRASVAVLPFENLSADPDQAYFAAGISEDIIAALSRYKWFLVIARNATFALKRKGLSAREIADVLGVRYVLAGSVRRSQKRIRISTELIDARSAVQLWAECYDFAAGELFAVQDRIAEQVVGAIEPELLKSESTLVARDGQAPDLTAWDLVHQGTWRFHQVTQPTHFRARQLFREACAIDPQLADAYAWLGRVCAGIVAYGWSDDESDDLREGISAALTAVRLDDKNPYAHYALAITSTFACEFGQAIRAAERAIELSPGFALGHLVLGMARLFSGDPARGAFALERGLTLNPHDPQNFVWHNVLAVAYLFDLQRERALQSAMNALKLRPDWRPAMETIVCCYQALGRATEAGEASARMRRMERGSADALAPLRRANPRWRDELQRLLQAAAIAGARNG
jgi:TolB-like protein